MMVINLVYIDDVIDPIISKYLASYKQDGVNIVYGEEEFDSSKGYESLVKTELVYNANVILIDSQLFENSTASNGKYTGEQFKLILKKIFPYIEVLVITQNEIKSDYSSTIAKYSYTPNEDANDYYSRALTPLLKESINKVCEYRNIIKDFCVSNDNKFLLDKINNSLSGIDTYDELKKEDIDNLINAFKKIEENMDDCE